jgi:hypothetical protein
VDAVLVEHGAIIAYFLVAMVKRMIASLGLRDYQVSASVFPLKDVPLDNWLLGIFHVLTPRY